MSDGTITIPVDLFYKLDSMALSSCRDLAYQLNKEYIYTECVKLQKEVQVEWQKWRALQPDDPLE